MAIIYRPPTSSPKHGVSVGQFCTEFSELLSLPGQLIACGDFNCPAPGRASSVASHLLEVLESHALALRGVDQPTHQDGHMLDLLMDIDCSGIITGVRILSQNCSGFRLETSAQLIQRTLQ